MTKIPLKLPRLCNKYSNTMNNKIKITRPQTRMIVLFVTEQKGALKAAAVVGMSNIIPSFQLVLAARACVLARIVACYTHVVSFAKALLVRVVSLCAKGAKCPTMGLVIGGQNTPGAVSSVAI